SVLIAIYNTMEDRKRDISVMRALGARKTQIFRIIILEAIVICTLGSIIGLFMGHLIVYYVTPHLADVAGIVISAFAFDTTQLFYIVLVIVFGALVGLIPAIKAYQTDAVKNLGSGK